MLKKKLLVFMISILACCSVVSGYSFTAKEETEQSTEKKHKKKIKRKCLSLQQRKKVKQKKSK